MNDLLYLIVLSFSSVIALFIIAKLMGKKQVAQLEFIDYVIGISIGSISAEMATDINETPLHFYLIALAIYFFVDLFISILARKSPWLKHFFKGRPLTVIYDGKIDYKILKKSKLDVNDVLALARTQGYFDLEKIAFAVFENNGKLSIMPKSNYRQTIAEDLNLNPEEASLPVYLVIDGLISKSSLNEIKKDTKWLLKKLNISKRNQLKNIILASYNEEKDQISVTYKSESN